jgi:hypothetical protein
MVMRHQVGDVGELPARREEVPPVKLLFAPDGEALVEAADREKCLPADYRRTRDEGDQRMSWLTFTCMEGRSSHSHARRVVAFLSTDQNVRLDERESRVLVEEIGGTPECTRLPPGVIVGQRDIRGRAALHTGVAAGAAGIPVEANHVDAGEGVAQRDRRIVG